MLNRYDRRGVSRHFMHIFVLVGGRSGRSRFVVLGCFCSVFSSFNFVYGIVSQDRRVRRRRSSSMVLLHRSHCNRSYRQASKHTRADNHCIFVFVVKQARVFVDTGKLDRFVRQRRVCRVDERSVEKFNHVTG
ncbi:hypothetical protein H310_07720 [Aphanomyces invadans]|uniref:Uncharacterized protein n=1 Tax=Aphanomyces invadans TaxID=157072 RepID=A0A024U169_9STRA|nr:hypothetical protein H310_07720 [Aphanomyces invadans]ETV99651.1 hypothetical protein H310_07720 [Aphanomyces invadans]|eukprot:XP_008871427.1 hypothetical protein H310_07720 [Aphanomyces invadans]